MASPARRDRARGPVARLSPQAIAFGPHPFPRSTRSGSASGVRATAEATLLVVGAIDRRVRAMACKVPLISGWRNVLRLVDNLVAGYSGP